MWLESWLLRPQPHKFLINNILSDCERQTLLALGMGDFKNQIFLLDPKLELRNKVTYLNLESFEQQFEDNSIMLKALFLVKLEYLYIYFDSVEVYELGINSSEFFALGRYVRTSLKYLESYFRPQRFSRIFNLIDSLHKTNSLDFTKEIVLYDCSDLSSDNKLRKEVLDANFKANCSDRVYILVATLGMDSNTETGWVSNPKHKSNMVFNQIISGSIPDNL